ncbi:MAG: 2-deoxy-D-gluconate 3-dehydrogenase [Rhizobiales bacterium 63-7]|nr:glucose 1-dehydrogenase [Hyphomicrobiales bacterium]OJU68133.1 MAG: 2-deoxy-D-gluconate 3-dehydrogenase [Rhizobiales bacterium 63-7]
MAWDDLNGKTALITGASSGLGKHFAGVLARCGVHVVLAARNEAALQNECDAILASGGQASFIAMDVTNPVSVGQAFENARMRFDIIVNNAGISGAGSALDIEESTWDAVVDTNLKGVFCVAQAGARKMREDKHGGSIVNIASILGLRVAGQVAAYTASKAAVVQLSQALALEWARYGIRVNALCPGYFETELNKEFFSSEAGQALIKRIPQRRLGRLEELDAPLLLLCSQAGSFITGATLAVDGGHLVSSL